MRALICAALLCAAGSSIAGDLVYKDDAKHLVLTREPCRMELANSAIKAELKDKHFQGSISLPAGRKLSLCWVDMEEDTIWMMDENGSINAIPVEMLKEELGA